jgi:hypothetical protein
VRFIEPMLALCGYELVPPRRTAYGLKFDGHVAFGVKTTGQVGLGLSLFRVLTAAGSFSRCQRSIALMSKRQSEPMQKPLCEKPRGPSADLPSNEAIRINGSCPICDSVHHFLLIDQNKEPDPCFELYA